MATRAIACKIGGTCPRSRHVYVNRRAPISPTDGHEAGLAALRDTLSSNLLRREAGPRAESPKPMQRPDLPVPSQQEMVVSPGCLAHRSSGINRRAPELGAQGPGRHQNLEPGRARIRSATTASLS
jgi:hypothetical protein